MLAALGCRDPDPVAPERIERRSPLSAVSGPVEVADPLGDLPLCMPGALDHPGEADRYTFTGGEPEDQLYVEALAGSSRPPSPVDTVLSTEAAEGRDSLFHLAGSDAALIAAVGQVVSVSDADPEAAGADRTYEICARIVYWGDQEPNDDRSGAAPLVGPPIEGVLLTAGSAGDRDVYTLPTAPERVYRAALVPGGAPEGVALALHGAVPRGAAVDDRSFALGYPPTPPVMFVAASTVTWLEVSGPAGAYVLAVEALAPAAFPPEVEPNDDLAHAQTVPLLRRADGSYANTARGTLEPGVDEVDTFLLDVTDVDRPDGLLNLWVQASSVGGDQDLALRVTDADTDAFIGLYADDPNGLLGSDPVVLRFSLANHRSLAVEVELVSDPAPSPDAWFLIVETRASSM